MLEPDQNDAPSVGETLRSARTSKKKALQHYADRLRIRVFYLENLEAGNYHELPALVYSIGFVKLYAQELGLDADLLVNQFKSEFTPPLSHSLPQEPKQNAMPGFSLSLKHLALGFSVVLLLGTGWLIKGYFGSTSPIEVASFQPQTPSDSPQEHLTEQPATPAVIPLSAPPSEPQAAALPVKDTPQPEVQATHEVKDVQTALDQPAEPVALAKPLDLAAKQKNNLILTATTDSWIEVRNSEKEVILSRVVQSGKTCSLPCQEGYTFSAGNAKGIRLELNGKKLNKFETNEKVIRDVSLDPDSLRARLSSQNR